MTQSKSSYMCWWLTNCSNSPVLVTCSYTHAHTHTVWLNTHSSTGNLILINICVACMCVASGRWFPVGHGIPEFPSGSVCRTWNTLKHTYACICTDVHSWHYTTPHRLPGLSSSWSKSTLLVEEFDPVLSERHSIVRANLRHIENSQTSWFKNIHYLVM